MTKLSTESSTAPYTGYQYHIFGCLNERATGHHRGCCASKNSQKLFDYFKHRVKSLNIPHCRVNKAGCMDYCEYGPTFVIYPEGIWYACASKHDIDHIIEAHLLNHQPVNELMIQRT